MNKRISKKHYKLITEPRRCTGRHLKKILGILNQYANLYPGDFNRTSNSSIRNINNTDKYTYIPYRILTPMCYFGINASFYNCKAILSQIPHTSINMRNMGSDNSFGARYAVVAYNHSITNTASVCIIDLRKNMVLEINQGLYKDWSAFNILIYSINTMHKMSVYSAVTPKIEFISGLNDTEMGESSHEVYDFIYLILNEVDIPSLRSALTYII